MIRMRPSRVLKKMREGSVATSVMVNIHDPRVSEIAAQSGFDCIWIDTEHNSTSLQDLENHVRAAKIYDTDVVVRVPRGSYSDLIHPLEVDATGIMVPHLMNVEEARKVAWSTKFHPKGRRPLDGGSADGVYCRVPVEEYIRHANEERFVIVQIEDPEPLEELDEIAAVDGIDMLLFGPGDFSHGLGIPGDFDDPRVDEARKKVAQAAHSHGKFAGTVGSPANLRKLAAEGFHFVNLGADVIALTTYFSELRNAIGEL